MRFEGFSFGSIRIDGVRVEHDTTLPFDQKKSGIWESR